MKRRNPCIFYSPLALLTLWVAGCSSSSGPNISGQGPLAVSKAQVCLDSNNNFVCDSGEATTRTDSTGSYELPVSTDQAVNTRLLWVVDGETVDAATGLPLPSRYTLTSMPGQPQTISIFSTLLGNQTVMNESALKAALSITEPASLLGAYAKDGQIDQHVNYLRSMYAGMFVAASSAPEATPASSVTKVVASMVSNPDRLVAHVANRTTPKLTLLSSTPPSTAVGEEIFQNIPIDASTMSFGTGMDEITRKVVSGSYCLDVLQAQLTAPQAISQNTRNFQFRLIKSEKDLRELLNVGGGLDLGTQVVQGSLEGRFVNEYRSNTDAVFALIKVEYVLSGYKLMDVNLNQKYLNSSASTASYVSNYDAFRQACGDRFLSQVATGGAYYGLLTITSSDSTKKQDLQVKLDGKYGKAGISVKVSGDLKSSVTESLSSTNVAITVGSRGVSPQFLGLSDPKDQLIDNLDKFFDAANQFVTAISNPANECHNDAIAPKKCAYTASFADYAAISGGVPRSQTQVTNLQFTQKIMGQYEDYKILKGIIDDVMINEPDYNWQRSDITSDDVWNKQADLQNGLLTMDSAFRKCTTDFVGCTQNTDANKLPSFGDVIKNLPIRLRENAKDCQDVQRIYGTALDRDEATIYLAGDKTKAFKVACTRMASSEPQTYLKIANTSGSTSSLSYNMAQNVNPDTSRVSSIYKKLRVNVNYSDIEIVNDQNDQVETASTASAGSTTAADNFASARLGTAVYCTGDGTGTGASTSTSPAVSNIDLTGTHFKFDDALTFSTVVHPKSKYEWVAQAMTWDAANSYAISKGKHLVVIDSADEWNTVHSLLLTQHNTNSWVGMKRTDTAQPVQYRQMQWVGSSANPSPRNLTSQEMFDYFSGGQPDNAGGQEACVHFWGNANLMLNDNNCGNIFPFLMERDLPVPPAGVFAINASRTTADISIKGAPSGVCSEIRPANGVIRLQYAP